MSNNLIKIKIMKLFDFFKGLLKTNKNQSTLSKAEARDELRRLQEKYQDKSILDKEQ